MGSSSVPELFTFRSFFVSFSSPSSFPFLKPLAPPHRLECEPRASASHASASLAFSFPPSLPEPSNWNVSPRLRFDSETLSCLLSCHPPRLVPADVDETLFLQPANLSPRANVFAALSRRSEAGLTKRETKAEAAARIRAVRLAAVRAARASAAAQLASIRATATRPNATPTNANGPPAPAPTSDVNPTPPAFPGTESAELAAIRIAIQKTRCGSDRACEAKFEQSGLPLPPNGAALCNRTIRNCVLGQSSFEALFRNGSNRNRSTSSGCAAGFTFAPNSTNCVPEITTCGANVSPFSLCSFFLSLASLSLADFTFESRPVERSRTDPSLAPATTSVLRPATPTLALRSSLSTARQRVRTSPSILHSAALRLVCVPQATTEKVQQSVSFPLDIFRAFTHIFDPRSVDPEFARWFALQVVLCVRPVLRSRSARRAEFEFVRKKNYYYFLLQFSFWAPCLVFGMYCK